MGYNFDGVPVATGGGDLEPGNYIAKITDVEDVTSQTGTAGVRLRLRLERLAEGGPAVDRTWSATWWLTPNTAPYVKGHIVTITGQEPRGDFNFRKLVGLRTIAVIRRKPNRDGELYPEVVGYNPLPSTEQDPLMAAAASVAAPAVGPGNAADDDIPF